MTKITIISCIIVAVCILQTTEARLFDFPKESILDNVGKSMLDNVPDPYIIQHPLENVKKLKDEVQNYGKKVVEDGQSMLDNVGKQVSNTLENVHELEKNVQNRGMEMIEDGKSMLDNVGKQVSNTLIKNLDCMIQIFGIKIVEVVRFYLNLMKNVLEIFLKNLQNVPTCTKIYSDGQEVISEIISIVKSCISNETDSVSADIQELTDAISNLEKNVSKILQNALNCYLNPSTVIPCFSDISQEIFKLGPLVDKVVSATYKFIELFPRLRVCYEKAFLQSVGPNANKLVKDAKQCIEGIIRPFKF